MQIKTWPAKCVTHTTGVTGKSLEMYCSSVSSLTSTFGRHLGHCVNVFGTFDKETTSVETHVNSYFECYKITDEDDCAFIMEVFSGSVRYSIIMKTVTDGFYAKDGKTSLISDKPLYTVLCYLILFHLDQLGVQHFKKFVQSQNVNKMYKFLNFFLSERNLKTWIKDAWGKAYEQSFVQTVLLQPLEKTLSDLHQLIENLKDILDNKIKPKKISVPTTGVKPFNLTKPQPKRIPLPEAIPKVEVHLNPPITLYRTPSDFTKITRHKEVNRREAEERLMEASRIQFACANIEKSQKTKELMNNIMSEEDGKLDFDKHKAKRVPSFLSQEVPVKLNAATILREGKLYERKEKEEIKKWEDLEAGARDTSAFMQWQSDMRQRDLDVQLAEIERRRLHGKLSHEEAILAKQNLIKDNKTKVKDMKKETEEMMQEYLQKKFKDEQTMKQLVEATMQGHRNVKDTRKKLQEYKHKIVQEANVESQKLMKQVLEKAESEMRRKMELITAIRAMEAVPVVRQKLVDLTSCSGIGLLGEMSIAELQERLALMRTSELEEEELRRDEILASKQAKDQLLLDTLENISKHRMEQTRAAALKCEARKKNRNVKAESSQDETLVELQKKIEEKKAERLREQQNNKITASKQSAIRTRNLISQKNILEENHWLQLENTRERSAKLLGLDTNRSANGIRSRKPIAMAT